MSAQTMGAPMRRATNTAGSAMPNALARERAAMAPLAVPLFAADVDPSPAR
jgi:hypothetical protein